MKKHTKYPFGKKIKYMLDEFVSKGFLAQILLLVGTSFALTLLFGVVALHLGQPNYEEGYWTSLMHMIDQGTITADEAGSDTYFVFMLVVTFIGMAFTSTTIAIINNAIQNKLDDLKKGHSAIIEKDHVLILGFDSSTCTICRELLEGGKKNGEHVCLVVADDLPKETMEQSVKEYRYRSRRFLFQFAKKQDQQKQIKVLIRSGNLTAENTFAICSAETAKTIFINPESDPETIRILLALVAYLKKNRVYGTERNCPEVVAVIHEKHNLDAAWAAAGIDDEIENNLYERKIRILNDKEMLCHLFAQACVHPGVSYALSGLFNNMGSSLYIEEKEEDGRENEERPLKGKTLSEISTLVNRAIPLGFARGNDEKTMKILLNPQAGEVYQSGDRLIYLSDTPELAFDTPDSVTPIGTPATVQKKKAEKQGHFLIFGWNETLPDMINHIECFCNHNTYVLISTPESKITVRAGTRLSRIDLQDPYCWEEVEPILEENSFWFDQEDGRKITNMMILPPADAQKDQADQRLMLLLLHIRQYLARHGSRDVSITSETLLPENQAILRNEVYNDCVIASEASDTILARLLEDPRKYNVIKNMLQPENGALMLNPLSEYTDTEKAFNFEYIFRVSAKRKTEIPFGWIRFGSEEKIGENEQKEKYTLTLGPSGEERAKRYEGGNYDAYRLVVFATHIPA